MADVLLEAEEMRGLVGEWLSFVTPDGDSLVVCKMDTLRAVRDAQVNKIVDRIREQAAEHLRRGQLTISQVKAAVADDLKHSLKEG